LETGPTFSALVEGVGLFILEIKCAVPFLKAKFTVLRLKGRKPLSGPPGEDMSTAEEDALYTGGVKRKWRPVRHGQINKRD